MTRYVTPSFSRWVPLPVPLLWHLSFLLMSPRSHSSPSPAPRTAQTAQVCACVSHSFFLPFTPLQVSADLTPAKQTKLKEKSTCCVFGVVVTSFACTRVQSVAWNMGSALFCRTRSLSGGADEALLRRCTTCILIQLVFFP